jgi:uncharacterized membrane protein YhaH (DUF805 family)
MRFGELWDWRGESNRTSYLIWGVILFAVKYNLDRVIAASFHRTWPFWSYVVTGTQRSVLHLSADDLNFFVVLAATSLPFIYVGVILTLRRLRDAGWPLWLVALFFIPLLNYVFFLVAAAAPSRNEPWHGPSDNWFRRAIPESPAGSAALSLAISIPCAVFAVLLAVLTFKDYGWGVFLGVPFWVGLVASLIHGYRQPRSMGQCLGVSALAVTFVGLALFIIAAEGIVCLAMAAPLAYPLALLGGALGFVFQRSWHEPPGYIFPALLLALPGLMFAEHARPVEPPLLSVTSTIEIDAPPEAVWRNVVSFQQIDEPREWYFHTGLAYPQRAEILGTGVGAERHCVFSTGAFVEPITVWDEPRLLKFGVSAEPPAMHELSPYPNVHPPHLDHYFSSKQGQFLLIALPGGRTRLEGTTWYRNRFWPQAYWQAWSDAIIHRIHMRVLAHVKAQSEARR